MWRGISKAVQWMQKNLKKCTILVQNQKKVSNFSFQNARNSSHVILFPNALGACHVWLTGNYIIAEHEFHETCHSVTFIVVVNSHQRWKQTRNRVCFHLWCELTLALWCHSIVWSLLSWKKMQRNDKFHGIHKMRLEVFINIFATLLLAA